MRLPTIKVLGVSDVTCYRRRNEYGEMNGPQLKKLKELEKENQRLNRNLIGIMSHIITSKIIYSP